MVGYFRNLQSPIHLILSFEKDLNDTNMSLRQKIMSLFDKFILA